MSIVTFPVTLKAMTPAALSLSEACDDRLLYFYMIVYAKDLLRQITRFDFL